MDQDSGARSLRFGAKSLADHTHAPLLSKAHAVRTSCAMRNGPVSYRTAGGLPCG